RVDRGPLPLPTHGVGAEDPARTGPSLVAHGGCCDRDCRHPGPIVWNRGGSPFRLLLSRARNPPRGRDDGPCPGPPGLPVAGPDGTLRRRRGTCGPWASSPVRGRVERPSLLRRSRGRGDRPREVAVPPILRDGRRTDRDRRGLLEREGDGGTVRGRGRRERARAPVREGPFGLRRAPGGRGRRHASHPARQDREETGRDRQDRPRSDRGPCDRGPWKPGRCRRRSPGEEAHPATDRIDPPEAGADRGGTGMKRIPTKMEGLDDVLGGGIPDGSVVLVSGAPGTMKTSLTYHILHANALDGARGLYVSLEQSRARLLDQTERLGYRLEDTDGNLSILDLGMLRKKLTGPP